MSDLAHRLIDIDTLKQTRFFLKESRNGASKMARDRRKKTG